MNNVIGQVIETEQGLFCVDPTDRFVTGTLIQQGVYGLDELQRILSFVGEKSSVLMLGVHFGSILIPLSKRVRHITAFEANPNTYRLLEINLLLNGCRNVTAYNLAANDSNGSIEFLLNTVNSGGSKRYPLARDDDFFYDNPEVRRVPAVALDQFLVDREYDLIFMDIEGSEPFAMRGMKRIASSSRVIFTEFIPKHLKKVAGVNIQDFVELFSDFQTLTIPSKRAIFYSGEFLPVLAEMYEKDEADAGIIFIRDRIALRYT